jgi:hypothetical protein
MSSRCACGSRQDPSHPQLVGLKDNDRSSQILGPHQLLLHVCVGVLSYYLGPKLGDQGWREGHVCVGFVPT